MNLAQAPNINYLWAQLIIEELYRNGVNFLGIAPGSRSSPLTIAAAQHPHIQPCVHYDERGLAFHALGHAAATHTPAVIITTSGTAVANCLPAVVEAAKKKLPLIILTADRPPELRHTGAMQTIDQVKIFGNYVKWMVDMPCPTRDIKLAAVLTTIDQAVYQARNHPPGVVHLNCMLREPLAPIKTQDNFLSYITGLAGWQGGQEPWTQYLSPERYLSPEKADHLSQTLAQIRQGVIVVGKLAREQDRHAVLSLARRLNWPIFADITSGLRLGHKSRQGIAYYDLMLLSQGLSKVGTIDGILHFGGRITSNRWYQFCETVHPEHYIMVLNHPLRNDPLHQVTLRIEGSAANVWSALQDHTLTKGEGRFLSRMQKLSEKIDDLLTTDLQKNRHLHDGITARLIAQHIPAQTGLFLGNSMPIRYMDMLAVPHGQPVWVEGNRGASGIDGNVAAAAGFARGLQKPVTLFIGDLALLHDLNSLSLLKNLSIPLIIVVLNNNGGGIFSYLPIAECPEVFERYFATPQDVEFAPVAGMFGIHYARPKTVQQFVAEYTMAFVRKRHTLIEVHTDRQVSLKRQRFLEEQVRMMIDKEVEK
jgi:2-succinyl-5-enolpyruvyl-6-hydroxy-3-cyclohexene-1-carboxylate synthase